MKKQVIVPRGLPGSGKTTWVKDQIAQAPAGTMVRISNDDLSAMLFGQPWGTFFFSDVTRTALADLRVVMLSTLLKQDGIIRVFIDNTNLATSTVRQLEKVAQAHDADFLVLDDLLAVPVEECIKRDAEREKPVGEDVIRKMHKDASKLKPWKYMPTLEVIPHIHDDELPEAILVDIDGTLAIRGDRDIYDFDKVGVDLPNPPVVKTVQALIKQGYKIIVMSGRKDSCRPQTEEWLATHVHSDLELHMRDHLDNRPDYLVKNDLFQENVAGRYNILFSLDDRNSVVNLWRNKLGIPTFQVDEGDF